MTLYAAADAAQEASGGGFGWSDGVVLAGAVLAAVIAVAGYTMQRKLARRAERADLYAKAIAAVEAYLEGPYRIRRKTGESANWFAISSALSDTKTTISLHIALLEMHAPDEVLQAYKAFVAAALKEAGPQMTAAWKADPITRAADIPLGVRYERADADAARIRLVTTMSTDLAKVGSGWWP